MIKVFLDTEFANLHDQAALLSLALVDERYEDCCITHAREGFLSLFGCEYVLLIGVY